MDDYYQLIFLALIYIIGMVINRAAKGKQDKAMKELASALSLEYIEGSLVRKPSVAGVYEGREVVLGPRSGDYYLVREGLEEGESVVVNGNFKIDSAIQILARPSMMNPEAGGSAPAHHNHGSGHP